MGPTGAGKSTVMHPTVMNVVGLKHRVQFINIAANHVATRVGHDLNSCTAEIQAVTIPHPHDPSRRVVFVDTPGFDDTYVTETEILKRIADWLRNA
jgi:hypothetical protein